jgi:hypothetical protein
MCLETHLQIQEPSGKSLQSAVAFGTLSVCGFSGSLGNKWHVKYNF